jgi:hypothetical protein
MSPTSGTYTLTDEGLSNPGVALGFTFPMPGTPGFTHIFVSTNGEIWLTDGSLPVSNALFGIDTLGELRGGAGASAAIVPWGDDMDDVGPGVGDIKLEQTSATCKVTWQNYGWYNGTDEFSFSVLLYDTGLVEFSYGLSGWPASLPSQTLVGLSIGNNVGSGSETSVDLTQAQDSGALPLIHQVFASGSADNLAGKAILFVPNGSGGYTSSVSCQQAHHATYGSGCYDISAATESFYELFSDSLSSSVLAGNSMVLTPTVGFGGYDVTWGGGAYVAPSGGALVLGLFDEDEQTITPSTPFPTVDGPASAIAVGDNGVVSFAAAPSGNWWDYFANTSGFLLNDVVASIRSHRDYDPMAIGGGVVKYEEVGSKLYVTFDGVFVYSTTFPETFQFQFDLTGPSAGRMTVVWQAMTGAGLSHDLLVGFSPGGPSNDPGPITLSTALPLVTSDDMVMLSPTLSASPNPVFTPGNPSVPMTWQIENLRDASPAVPGLYLGLLIFSASPPIGGTGLDLTVVGIDAPGCTLLVGSVDVSLGIADLTPSIAYPIQFPQPLSPGDTFFSQVMNFVVPNTLPNGQNGGGMIVTNGEKSYFYLV